MSTDDDTEITTGPPREGQPKKGRAPPPKPNVKEDKSDGTEVTGKDAVPYEGKEGWDTFEAGEVYISPPRKESTQEGAGSRKKPSDPIPEGTFLFNTGKTASGGNPANEHSEIYSGVRGKYAPGGSHDPNKGRGPANPYDIVESKGGQPLQPLRAPTPYAPPPAPATPAGTSAAGWGPPPVPGSPTSFAPPMNDGYSRRAAPASDSSTEVTVGGQPKHARASIPVPPLPSQGTIRVLVVGSGAREHAIALAVKRSPRGELYVATKHRNPGLTKAAMSFRLLAETDVPNIVDWARQRRIQLAVIGPESSLSVGLADALRENGIAVASPSQAAAQIEVSKTFMRELMKRHNVPGQLGFQAFSNAAEALRFLDQNGPVWAIKPVGLTGGKGVQVFGDHFHDLNGAKAYTNSIFAGNVGGGIVQFEELARGEEYTIMAFTDGKTVIPMPAVQDHKRLRDGDLGPNTGGMGSYSQADGLLPFLDAQSYSDSVRILQGLIDALRADGTPYVGAIYGQFMLTTAGPKVIEVNARFGDPEAMNVLHLLESDYVQILAAMAEGRLAGANLRFRPRATVVKYLVPNGYGEGHATSSPVEVDEFNVKRAGASLFYAHVEQSQSGPLMTMTSRAIAVLGEGNSVPEAEAICSAGIRHVHGDLRYRADIGTAALLQKRVAHMQELLAKR